jgi:hypothetical protein
MPRPQADPKFPDSIVRITDFPGMSPGTDQHDNEPGLAWIQVNAVSLFPGELRARRGFRVVRFNQPSRPRIHDVAAVASYVVSQSAFLTTQAEFFVDAGSTYTTDSSAATGSGFSLMTLL